MSPDDAESLRKLLMSGREPSALLRRRLPETLIRAMGSWLWDDGDVFDFSSARSVMAAFLASREVRLSPSDLVIAHRLLAELSL